MPNPFPGLFEVSGEQRVPELRSELSKNTSLAGGGGGEFKQKWLPGKLSSRHVRTFR